MPTHGISWNADDPVNASHFIAFLMGMAAMRYIYNRIQNRLYEQTVYDREFAGIVDSYE